MRVRGWVIARRARHVACATMVGTVYVFLFAPLVVVVGASFDGGEHAFINFPPSQFSLAWYWDISARYFDTLWVSLSLATVTAALSVLLGVPTALALVRSRIRGIELLAALFRAPLQIPFVVTGIAFLQLYYVVSDATGFFLVGSFTGLTIAHTFLSMPYVVGTVVAILQRFDHSLEEAAVSLGASRWSTFRRVTLPVIMPGVYAGTLYAFIVSFGDVPVSLFLASPQYTTFPVEVFQSMEFDFDTALLAISTLILVGSLIVLWLVQRAVGLDILLRSGSSN